MTVETDPAEVLAALLEAENAALRAMDAGAVAALVPAKRSAIARLTDAGAGPAPDAAVLQRLRDLAAENRALLERAMAVQGRIIELVAAAIRPAMAAPRYGATGTMAASRQVAACALSARA